MPPDRRIGLAERVDHTGAAVLAPDGAAIADAVARVKATGVESVAVSLFHAYANPAHERAVGQALAAALPFVSLSHEVNPETREFERTATTVLNASVMPIAARYLDRLQREVKGARLHVMHSAGGMASPEAAARRPLAMALSGPAAGVSAAAHVAASLGLDKVLSFDMGGTTTDVCLITGGAAEISTDSKLAGRPVRQPMVAVELIGAGGGSLVTHGTGGLSIGPESAGAEPGPAAYGRGGTRPTVTDANAVLGYLDPTRRLGGAITLDVAAAEAALAPLAHRLGVSVVELALGVQRVANATMVRALARVTVERGVDGRQCTLLAFGGAGPMHAARLAREFGIGEIVVPRFSSGFSALGCIVADMSYTQQQSVRMLSTHWDADRFGALQDGMLKTLDGATAAPGPCRPGDRRRAHRPGALCRPEHCRRSALRPSARSRRAGPRLPPPPQRDLRLRDRRALGDAEPARPHAGAPADDVRTAGRIAAACRSRPASARAGSSRRRRTRRRASIAIACRRACGSPVRPSSRMPGRPSSCRPATS